MEVDGLFTGPHFAFGLDVISQNGTTAGVTHLSDFLEYHFAIPNVFGQSHIDVLHKGAEFFHPQPLLLRRR